MTQELVFIRGLGFRPSTASGGGTPGGSNTQIQYNNSGAFAGSSNLIWDNSAQKLSVGGSVNATYTTDNVLRNSFVQYPTTASRNDANFVIGHTFYPADYITVSQLGRLYVAGNSQNHAIGIYNRATSGLVASGTILAASSSDANGFKWVSITPVVLSPLIEYAIVAVEFGGGDTWKESWDSTNYFDTYIKRTGFAYASGSSLTPPVNYGTSNSIYNTCAMKYTVGSVVQVKASYNSSNFVGMLSRSDGTSTMLSSNADKLTTILNPLSLGGGQLDPNQYQFGVFGNSLFQGTTPVKTVANGPSDLNSYANFGAFHGAGANGVFCRSGYILIESGSSTNQVLINYDNAARDVSISGIGSNTKLTVFPDSASKKGVVVRMAASPTANAIEVQNSAGTVLASVSAAGGITGRIGTASFTLTDGSSDFVRATDSGTGFSLHSGWALTWGAVTAGTSIDTAIRRNAAGILEINNGTAGQWRSLRMGAASAATVAEIVRAATAQTANLTEWQNSAGTALTSIDKNGGIVPASMTDATAANGTLYYSTTASKLVYKDSGGTVNALY